MKTPALRTDEHRTPPDSFDAFADAVRARALTFVGKPLFTVYTPRPLFDVYLESFASEAAVRTNNCRTCRRFLNGVGKLVAIEDGRTVSVFWGAPGVPPEYLRASEKLAASLVGWPVDGVFLSDAKEFGQLGSKPPAEWRHFHVPHPLGQHAPSPVAAEQRMAEKHQDCYALKRALEDFSADAVRRAEALLRAETLYRGEKVLGVATWLFGLHRALDGVKDDRRRDNIIWSAVATAPPGFCHVRSSMIGTLLEDLAGGMPFEMVARRFSAKMDPLKYQRPSSPPSEGNIAQAEVLVGKLRSAGALARRFARLEDVTPLWRPRAPGIDEVAQASGVFGHLRPRGVAPLDTNAPAIQITWDKFRRTVLPTAERMDLLLPRRPTSFLAFITAVDPSAPPIVQWDREDKRNPVTWYVYQGGSYAEDWNCDRGAFRAVTAIALSPAAWDRERQADWHGGMAVFILQGARDLKHIKGGGLFPEHTKSEYHSVRKTLEAHFSVSGLAGKDDATACGVAIQSGSGFCGQVLRVTAGGVRMQYRLDRWD